ncbi:MAG: hypothetical protein H0T76_12100 [Nannocystis sp.]|nr:hypothetical protein [Nannocystis sp.]MBA3547219.1 hypothetical protein [Nannocystis sp.]
MSRKGLIIRVLIFGPLFAYFGYGAVQKWRAGQADERGEAEARAAREAELGAATKTVKLGDGRTIDIVELTPEQAERLHGIKVSEGLEKAKEGDATKDAEALDDAKALGRAGEPGAAPTPAAPAPAGAPAPAATPSGVTPSPAPPAAN